MQAASGLAWTDPAVGSGLPWGRLYFFIFHHCGAGGLKQSSFAPLGTALTLDLVCRPTAMIRNSVWTVDAGMPDVALPERYAHLTTEALLAYVHGSEPLPEPPGNEAENNMDYNSDDMLEEQSSISDDEEEPETQVRDKGIFIFSSILNMTVIL